MIIRSTVFLFFILCTAIHINVSAQTDSASPVRQTAADTLRKQQDSLAKQKDILDIVHSLLRKKANQKPTVVKRFNYSIVPSIGYTLSTGFAADLTGNVAFYAEPKMHENLSAISSGLSYNQRSQITFRTVSTIWTKDDDYNFVGDWRWYKYPENTYGLGSSTTASDLNPIKYNFVRFYETVLKKIQKNFYGGLGYALDYHYSIVQNGVPLQNITGYQVYGQTSSSLSSGIIFNLLYDNRTNSINPKYGSYVNLIYRPNLKLLGSNQNWQLVTFDFRKYVPLTSSRKSILAFWTLENFTIGHPPYFDLPSIGWDMNGNTGRGYVTGRYRGQNMLYAETEYRFTLSKNGLLGGVLFANAQSFSDYPANRFQKVLPAFGPGLRIKFNKRSDTNICIDYGIGTGNSHGLFVNLGEVF
ncbi:BamA/TamA family outer membrane protein [uncultured Mucilaginibacter sp.]|uniref:BamA/TamA family outer membrane protein n=1 Tax=uncultured Mucilaginibacter sp. TaxID=797541 RepID=UPI0026225921|nr:BamA/TamA family outer membrane protein [uncultured Mucilaginibacter sp.]